MQFSYMIQEIVNYEGGYPLGSLLFLLSGLWGGSSMAAAGFLILSHKREYIIHNN